MVFAVEATDIGDVDWYVTPAVDWGMFGLWVEVVDCVTGGVADALDVPAIY